MRNVEFISAVLGIIGFLWMVADAIKSRSAWRTLRNIAVICVLIAALVFLFPSGLTPASMKHPGNLEVRLAGLMYVWTDIRNGENNQVHEYRDRDGNTLTRLRLKNGKLHGKQTIWHEQSPTSVLHEADFTHGARHGLSATYYTNGQIWFSLQFTNGQPSSGNIAVYDQTGAVLPPPYPPSSNWYVQFAAVHPKTVELEDYGHTTYSGYQFQHNIF